MAVRTILDVEVDRDGAFANFAKQFDAYQDQLAKSKAAWKETTGIIAGSRTAFEELVETAKSRLLQTKLLGEAEKQAYAEVHAGEIEAARLAKLRREAEEQARGKTREADKERQKSEKDRADQEKKQAKAWENMQGNAKKFASFIGDATKSLLQWGALTGVISGLVGAGGLYGIDRLAIATGTQRRSGLGLGVSPGEQGAFELNFGRVVDPGSVLGGVNDALHDPRKSVPFYGLGLNYREEQQKGTFGASVDVLAALKKLADATPKGQEGVTFEARKLADLGLSLQDFLRIKNTPASEMADYGRRARGDVASLDLPPDVQKQWQNLQVQLDRAGRGIERAFIIGLAPLTPQIKQLSEDFQHLISDLLGSPDIKDVIVEIDGWLKEFDDYLKSGKLKSDIEYVGHEARRFAKFIGSIVGEEDTKKDRDSIPLDATIGAGIGGVLGRFFGPLGGILGGAAGGAAGGDWAILNNFAKDFDDRHPWAKSLDRMFGLYGSAPPPSTDNSPDQIYDPAAYRRPVGAGLQVQDASFRPASYRTSMGGDMAGRSAREKEAHDFFRWAGYGEGQTAGILGNLKGESGFNPSAFNPAGGGQGAAGIGQWRGSRQTDFERLFGHSLRQSSFEEQLAFVQYELTHKEKAVGDKLRALGKDDAAGSADLINREYERSGGSSGGRVADAQQYAHVFRDRSAKVVIQNQTGGNAHVTVAALAV